MSNFRVGQKVVCVDDSPGAIVPNGGRLKVGAVYTIAAINSTSFPEVAVQLSEFNYRWYEWVAARRFRPAVTRKTDISIFRRMLNPQKPRTDA